MIMLLPLQWEYCEAVAAIAKESLPEHWSLNGIRDVLRYDNNVYYVACDMDRPQENSERYKSDQAMERNISNTPGKIVGFAGIMLIADEAELLNIAVTPPFRKCGIGQMLLERVIAEADRRGAERILLEVRKSNTCAMRLYQRNHFRKLAERRNYYTNPKEDAVIMERKL